MSSQNYIRDIVEIRFLLCVLLSFPNTHQQTHQSYKMFLTASPKRKRNKDGSASDPGIFRAKDTIEDTAQIESAETIGVAEKSFNAPTPVSVPGFEDVYLSPSPSQARKIAISRIRLHLAKKSSEVNAKDSVHSAEVRLCKFRFKEQLASTSNCHPEYYIYLFFFAGSESQGSCLSSSTEGSD